LAARWAMLGVPLDCSGANRGEALAPGALREAGLSKLGWLSDEGDVDAAVTDATRDAISGVIGFDEVMAGAEHISNRIGEVLEEGRRPLVVGGDCTLLVGVFAALARRPGRRGLWFVDGHLDCFDGETSPTGECADMDLAILTGAGPIELAEIAGPPPLVEPTSVVALGHRSPEDSDSPEELNLVHAAIRRAEASVIRFERGPAAVGSEAAAFLAGRANSVWLHLDLDVLDASVMPAVSYPQGGGIDWRDLELLLAPLVAQPALAGVSVADYNPERDPGGAIGQRVVELLDSTLGGA
jgi:arginase